MPFEPYPKYLSQQNWVRITSKWELDFFLFFLNEIVTINLVVTIKVNIFNGVHDVNIVIFFLKNLNNIDSHTPLDTSI
jgi:hypothetical protein